jgi:hypothetical protein
MKLEEVKKILTDAEVDSAVIDAVIATDDTPEIDALKKDLDAEKGKTAGILDDKKKFKERAETAESKLKEIEDGKLSEDERTAKRIKELEEKLESEKADRVRQEQEIALKERDAQLSSIVASVKWADGVPTETAKLIVEKAFKDVEDLADADKVKAVTATMTEAHKSFITAGAPKGKGTKAESGEGGESDDEPATMKELVEEAWEGKAN